MSRGITNRIPVCIENFEAPVHAGVLWQARIQGTATVRIALNDRAEPQRTEVRSPHEALTHWFTAWFARQKFLQRCANQTLGMTLRYTLEGPPRDSPSNRTILKHPGVIEVISNPPRLHPSVD